MNRIAIVAALAMLVSGAVLSQTQGGKPAASGAATETKAEKDAAPAGASKPAAVKVRQPRRNVDARGCLKFATNLEIHRCAEKYR